MGGISTDQYMIFIEYRNKQSIDQENFIDKAIIIKYIKFKLIAAK